MILAVQLTNTGGYAKKSQPISHFYKDIWQNLADGGYLPGNIADLSQL